MAESYNSTGGAVKTLVGNWQEEQELRKAAVSTPAAAGVYAGLTFERVVLHSEHEMPKDWKAHSTDAFAPPASRNDLLPVSYPKVAACGPRQAQALQQMLQQVATQEPAQAEQTSFETSYQAEYQAKTMDGIQIGHKVMRPDGSPAARDPVFLQEMGIVPNAGRLMMATTGSQQGAAEPTLLTKLPSLGYVRAPGAGGSGGSSCTARSGLTSSSIDPAVPITMYTEAAAKASYTGTFYGTATLGKGLMARNDQFTKLMGDANKQQRLL